MSQDSSANAVHTNAAKKMKAMMLPRFGGGDQFRLEDIERPFAGDAGKSLFGLQEQA